MTELKFKTGQPDLNEVHWRKLPVEVVTGGTLYVITLKEQSFLLFHQTNHSSLAPCSAVLAPDAEVSVEKVVSHSGSGQLFVVRTPKDSYMLYVDNGHNAMRPTVPN
jgi:hypothetical protein